MTNKIFIISISFGLLFLSCVQKNKKTTKTKKNLIIQKINYKDTVFIDSYLTLLKSGNDYLIKIDENKTNPALFWEVKSNNKKFTFSYDSIQKELDFNSLKFEKNKNLIINIKNGYFYWKENAFFYQSTLHKFILNGYSWESLDTNKVINIELDSIYYDGSNFTFGKNFFSLMRINYVSDYEYSFLEGSYINVDEKKHKLKSLKARWFTNINLVNNNINSSQEGDFIYNGFIMR